MTRKILYHYCVFKAKSMHIKFMTKTRMCQKDNTADHGSETNEAAG